MDDMVDEPPSYRQWFELALSIGDSWGLNETCESFIYNLSKAVRLHRASVWVKLALLGISESKSQSMEGFACAGNAEDAWLPDGFEAGFASAIRTLFDNVDGFTLLEGGPDDDVLYLLSIGNSGFLKLSIPQDEALDFHEKSLPYLLHIVPKLAAAITSSLIREQYVEMEYNRALAERKLEALQRQAINVVEHAMDAVVTIDKSGKIMGWNLAATALTGWQKHETEGKRAVDFLFFDHVPEALQDLFSNNSWTQANNNPLHARRAETVLNKKGGGRVEAEISVSPIIHYEIEAIHLIFRDIGSEKKQKHDLLEAKKKAEASVGAKKVFLANMSHEIRTPMNAVRGMAGLLAKTNLDSVQEKYLDAIKVSADGLLDIINDILDFSKIEAGKLVLEEEVFSFETIVQNIMKTMKYRADEKGLEFFCISDPRLSGYFMADAGRITQVLVNLINNALKFTESGAVTLSCVLDGKTDEAELVCFNVRDTGKGIAADKLQEVFESFSQEDAGISKKYGGTGLGLAICKQIVEQMGGEINLKSKAGIGSEFYFTLPLKPAAKVEQSVEKTLRASFAPQKYTVLLAEDHDINRFYAITLLEQNGLKVYEAKNGQEACNYLAKMGDIFDLVLMDIQMPEMDGLEATKFIREKLKSTIPIVALTANAFKGEKEKYMAAGMDAYLAKPFEEEELLNVLRQFLAVEGEAGTPNADGGFFNAELMLEEENEEPAFSLNYLFEVFNKKDDAVKAVEMLKKNLPSMISEFKNGVQENNMLDLKSVAHKLKTTAKILEIRHLSVLIKEIEGNDGEGLPEKYRDWSQRLESILTEVIDGLSLIRHEQYFPE